MIDPRRTPAALAASLTLIILAGCGGPVNREQHTLSGQQMLDAGWPTRTFDAWRQTVRLDDELPTYSDVGAYPVGNGRVFGIVGLSLPLGTVQDMLGPTYQKATGLLGSVTPAVLLDGQPVSPSRQSTAWVAPGGIVLSTWQLDGVQVDLWQTIPPETDAVLTMMLVSSDREAPVDVTLALQSSVHADSELDGDLLCSRGSRVIRLGFAGAETRVEHRSALPEMPEGLSERLLPAAHMIARTDGAEFVACPLGAVEPGQSVGKIAYVAVGEGADAAAAVVEEVEQGGWGLFEDAHGWWQRWHEATLVVEGAGEEIDQFMAIEKYLCRVQQAEAGGYSPMHKYTYRWIRDANGPIQFLLDCGDFASVDRDLSYHVAACAIQGEIGNNCPLDLDPAKAGSIAWSEIPTPKAEIASFVILQNCWWWRHTGRTERLAERWAYLARAFEGHEVDAQGRLPFHGDETYRFPGYELANAEPESASDYVHMTLRSADSAFEYVAAAEAMGEMAEALGRDESEVRRYREAGRFVRDATERLYWQEDRGYYAPAMSAVSGERYRYPFANICLRPTWIGYAPPDERRRRNTLNALRHLYRSEAGTCNLTPACGYCVGMTPGYVLSALTAIDHPEADHALGGLLAAASPSGGFAEMNRPDDTPARDVWGLHRVRPWEGGINGSAVLQYLTGFEPDAPGRRVSFAPHLPGGVDHMTVRNLCAASVMFDLSVERAGRRTTYEISPTSLGPAPQDAPDVEILASAPGEELRAVGGNWRERRSLSEGTSEPKASTQPGGFGRARLLVGPMGLLDTVTLTVEASGDAMPAVLDVADEPFDYGSADVAVGATVLLTWSAEVAEQVRAREGDVTVIDTRIAWPAEYLRSALLTEAGSPRVETVITDIGGWPGAFKPAEFWAEGEGAEVVSAYESVGGEVRQAEVSSAGGAPPSALIN